MANFIEVLEKEELINKLRENGYAELVDAFLLNETKAYTKKGRLNKSGACRVLGWKSKQLEEALAACREILQEDSPEQS